MGQSWRKRYNDGSRDWGDVKKGPGAKASPRDQKGKGSRCCPDPLKECGPADTLISDFCPSDYKMTNLCYFKAPGL